MKAARIANVEISKQTEVNMARNTIHDILKEKHPEETRGWETEDWRNEISAHWSMEDVTLTGDEISEMMEDEANQIARELSPEPDTE